jgi:SAM-dependent methyltransferase
MTMTPSTNDFNVYAGSVRREMLDFIPRHAKRILEVGCSVGNFGELLKMELGAEVWGVEADEKACSIAADKIDRAVCGLFSPGLALPRAAFDCVVFNDVLEHMVDPYSALAHAKELLSSGGVLVASIPNVRYFGNIWNLLVRKTWDYSDTGILDRTHLRFFTERSIRSTFDSLGYDILRIAGINAVDYADPDLRQRFRVLNLLTFKSIGDMRWMQFAVVARPRSTDKSE